MYRYGVFGLFACTGECQILRDGLGGDRLTVGFTLCAVTFLVDAADDVLLELEDDD